MIFIIRVQNIRQESIGHEYFRQENIRREKVIGMKLFHMTILDKKNLITIIRQVNIE